MQRKEPATGLVNSFCDKVGRINLTAIQFFLMFERIMDLCIRHGTGIEPYVDKVCLTFHRFTARTNQKHIIHERTMKIDLIIIGLIIVTGNEAFILQRIVRHHTGSNSLFYFIVKFLYRTDADFFTVFRTPDRQWSSPISASTQVPVIKILQPFSETAGSSRSRFPVDGLVEFDHAILCSCTLDKPAVQRIIEHGLVCSPAMRIIVHMLLNLECLVGLLHHHADLHIKCFVFVCLGRIISILHELAFPLAIQIHIDFLCHKLLIQLLKLIELSCQIDHRTKFTFLVNQMQWRYAGSFGHLSIIRTKSRRNMHDTGTVLCRHIISGNNSESAFTGIYPRHKLRIVHTDQISTCVFTNNLIWNDLVTRLIVLQRHILTFGIEIGTYTFLGHYDSNRL